MGVNHFGLPEAAFNDQTSPGAVIGPNTCPPVTAVDPTMPPTADGGPTIVCDTPFIVLASTMWYTPDFCPMPITLRPLRVNRFGEAPRSMSRSMHDPSPCG